MSPLAPNLRTLLGLAWPIVLARATQAVVGFTDALMVAPLGENALAAVTTGALDTFVCIMLPMGTVFIIQTFAAQLRGRGELEAVRRYAWYGLILALGAGALAALAIPGVPWVLSLLPYSPEVAGPMASFIAIRLTGVAAIIGTEALGNWYGGLGNTWMAMVGGLISMAVAVFANWVLIDGHLGAPAMGVAGAAWGSVIASYAGLAFLAVAFWRGWGNAPRAAGKLGLSIAELRRVVRFGLPNGMNWFLEFAAFQLFVNGVLASLGDETVAALNVVIAVNSISFMPAFGLASAGAILAGQAIGRGDRAAVWPQLKVTLACTCAWTSVCGALYLVAPHWVLSQFEEPGKSGNLVAIGTGMLALSAAWQVFDATAMTLAETLRAAGDTFWTATARLILAWAVFMPAAFIVVRSFAGGPMGAMLCLAGYMALLATAFALRFRSGAWKTIELIEPKLV
jgi:MATE family multidrug resistance protein